MLGDGLILGVFTLLGFSMIYKKLPKGVKVMITRHPLATDVLLAVVFYSVMGFTLVAHVAAATMTLGAMGMLYVAKNPQDFDFVYDTVDRMKATVKEGLSKLREMNQEYKQRKLAA